MPMVRRYLPPVYTHREIAAWNVYGTTSTQKQLLVFSTGNISGVVSERDYVCKIALLGKTSKVTPIKGAYLVIYFPSFVGVSLLDAIEPHRPYPIPMTLSKLLHH